MVAISTIAAIASVASTAVGVGVGVSSAVQQKKATAKAAAAQEQAARDASRLSEMNAMAQERETAQQASNLAREQGKEMATNRAKAAASGVRPGGSFNIFMDAQGRDDASQLSWLRGAGRSQAGIIRAQGQSAYNVGMTNAEATATRGKAEAISGIGNSVVGGIGDIYGISNNAGWLT